MTQDSADTATIMRIASTQEFQSICLSEYLTYQQLELRKMSKSYLGSYNWYLKIKLLDLADTAIFWECMYRQIISPSTRSSRTLGVHFLGKTMSFGLIVQTAAQLQFKESKESLPRFLTGWTNLWSPMRTTSASDIVVVRKQSKVSVMCKSKCVSSHIDLC